MINLRKISIFFILLLGLFNIQNCFVQADAVDDYHGPVEIITLETENAEDVQSNESETQRLRVNEKNSTKVNNTVKITITKKPGFIEKIKQKIQSKWQTSTTRITIGINSITKKIKNNFDQFVYKLDQKVFNLFNKAKHTKIFSNNKEMDESNLPILAYEKEVTQLNKVSPQKIDYSYNPTLSDPFVNYELKDDETKLNIHYDKKENTWKMDSYQITRPIISLARINKDSSKNTLGNYADDLNTASIYVLDLGKEVEINANWQIESTQFDDDVNYISNLKCTGIWNGVLNFYGCKKDIRKDLISVVQRHMRLKDNEVEIEFYRLNRQNQKYEKLEPKNNSQCKDQLQVIDHGDGKNEYKLNFDCYNKLQKGDAIVAKMIVNSNYNYHGRDITFKLESDYSKEQIIESFDVYHYGASDLPLILKEASRSSKMYPNDDLLSINHPVSRNAIISNKYGKTINNFHLGVDYIPPSKSEEEDFYQSKIYKKSNELNIPQKCDVVRTIDTNLDDNIPIFAAHNGLIVKASDLSLSNFGICDESHNYSLIQANYGYGSLVIIEGRGTEGQFIETRYGHLKNVFVRLGDYVKAGDMIGFMGSTGNSTGRHLHFEVKIDNKRIDPTEILGGI